MEKEAETTEPIQNIQIHEEIKMEEVVVITEVAPEPQKET